MPYYFSIALRKPSLLPAANRLLFRGDGWCCRALGTALPDPGLWASNRFTSPLPFPAGVRHLLPISPSVWKPPPQGCAKLL